jgi:bifunctional non-homologous end joining protein LigD
VFWPELRLTKGDLLRYYLEVSGALLPHLRSRAMVMKRYPHGAAGPFFFMKRAPAPRPAWIETCAIEHESGNVIDFPMVQDRAALLWVVNLGCIDLNQWYARCDDVDRPDYVHFDLDPGAGAQFEHVLESARVLHDALDALKMPSVVKTTGSKGLHVYVPIVRGPVQKQVWTFAKALAAELAGRHPALMTAEYRVAKRPRGRVLVDYNQNAWGRTLASIYSVRPRPDATVSTPVTWKEIDRGVRIEQFSIANVPARIARLGDLWQPLLRARGRFDLSRYV